MPIVGGNDGNDMLAMAFQMIRQAQERRARQGAALVQGALPGQTVADVGMAPKQYAELYGKETPFNPTRVLRQETATDLSDKMFHDWLAGQPEPVKQDYIATILNNRSGVAGPTTMSGYKASQQAAGLKGETGFKTQQTVSDAIDLGLGKFKAAAEDVRARFGQQAALGTSTDEQDQMLHTNLLKTAATNQVLMALKDPTHPMNKWLGDMGLDIGTVVGTVAAGAETLLSSYGSILYSRGASRATIEEKLAQAEIDDSKRMAEALGGKFTVRQIDAMKKAVNSGQPIPKGMEPALELYTRGVNTFHNANVTEAGLKGNPTIMAMKSQMDMLAKNPDPRSTEAAADISRRMAAYAAALRQFNYIEPTDEQGKTIFNAIVKKELESIPSAYIYMPLSTFSRDVPAGGYGSPGYQPAPGAPVWGIGAPPPAGAAPPGAAAPSAAPAAPTAAPAPTGAAPAQPVQPVQPVAPAGIPGLLGPTLTPQLTPQQQQQPTSPAAVPQTPGGGPSPGQLDPGDFQAILHYLQTVGGAPATR